MSARHATKDPGEKTYAIHVLQRALHILDVLLQAQQPLSMEAISQQTNTPKSTTFRILTNLLREGYLTRSDEGYWLGLKLLSLGSAVEQRLDYQRIAGAHIRRLRDLTGETVYLATLTPDMQVMYLDKIASQHPIGVTLRNPGMTAPLHCTALGKVMAAYYPDSALLAYLADTRISPCTANTITDPVAFTEELQAIRARGYALDNMEFTTSITCLAAPIFDRRGQVVAAISVAGPNERMPQPLIGSTMAAQVVESARRISTDLGAPASVLETTMKGEK